MARSKRRKNAQQILPLEPDHFFREWRRLRARTIEAYSGGAPLTADELVDVRMLLVDPSSFLPGMIDSIQRMESALDGARRAFDANRGRGTNASALAACRALGLIQPGKKATKHDARQILAEWSELRRPRKRDAGDTRSRGQIPRSALIVRPVRDTIRWLAENYFLAAGEHRKDPVALARAEGACLQYLLRLRSRLRTMAKTAAPGLAEWAQCEADMLSDLPGKTPETES
jgi:hypothetical protein